MLDTTLKAPQTMRYAAILEPLTDADAEGARLCRVHHRNGTLEAWTWLPAIDTSAAMTGEVTTMEIQCADTEFLVLGFEPLPEIPLAEALDEQRCPIPGLVPQVSDLIESLRSAALYRFVREALLHPQALAQFWTSPASRRDHHAHAGGLAAHTLEVATMVASSTGVPADDREIGIVYALLHDYGKLWCYGASAWGRDSRAHEQIGYEALLPALDRLIEAEPEAGAKLAELLGGPRAPRDTPYPLAIGKIVRAFDQMSCEKTRRPELSPPTFGWPASLDGG
ncbi:TraI domain-containing protein [Silanimonas sp.]|uniref:TraI domain-containing protein n=1 Tax=Silanimonas sp. TaxID=1929290 RepID=UPI0022BD0A67|nr:TraI domain-containing protein [Silanimonas sp.]MCZ8167194.1 TraI domain-containing protein [Silanimonas sp.]